MRVRIVRQVARKLSQILAGEKRDEFDEILEDVIAIHQSDSMYITFQYRDGTRYSIERSYLTKYEILPQ